MVPRVVLHSQVSVDGRTRGFDVDMGLHYETALHFAFDAHLVGCDTLLVHGDALPPEDDDAFDPPEQKPDDPRPLLVVPDSRGRLRSWHYLRKQPYWRGLVALCSRRTADEYLEYLRTRHVDYVIEGEDHVDLPAALEAIADRYEVKVALVDSGGTLNSALLRAGLVQEISVLIGPWLAGGAEQGMVRGPESASPSGAVKCRLSHVERLKNDFVWVRYELEGADG